MRSKVLPGFLSQISQQKSSLFFVININIKQIDEGKNLKLKRIMMKLTWTEKQITGQPLTRHRTITSYSDNKAEMA